MKAMLLNVSAVALISAMAAPAYAQETQAQSALPQAGQSGGLEEIVVTARKVAENNQKVPVAVTAFNGRQLVEQGAANVGAIANLTPGLAISGTAASQVVATFTIRGQIQPDTIATLDPSVGVYVDGYYWARATGINANLLDINNVQTLKGPQGTLFGRNTTGGAVLITTNDPNFHEGYSALASAGYGSFNQRTGTLVVNAPLIADRLAVRLAIQGNKRDGYGQLTNTRTNVISRFDTRDDYTLRAKVLFQATDTLRFLFSAEQYRAKFIANPLRTFYIAPAGPSAIETGVEATGGGCFAGGLVGCLTAGNTASAAAIATLQNTDNVATSYTSNNYAKTQTFALTTSLDTFFGAIKAIGGIRKAVGNNTNNVAGSPYGLLASRGFQSLKQESIELQATGKAFQNKVEFAAGLFYFHESGSESSYNQALPALAGSGTNVTVGNIENNSMGVYAQADFHLTDKLTVTGGLRYSVDDKKDSAVNGVYSSGDAENPAPGATFTCGLPTCPLPLKGSFNGVSYTFGLDYRFTPDIMGYVKTAKGFRAGGVNLRANPVFPQTLLAFQPETATSYEGGVKSEFFDRHLRVNLAGYYTIDENIQRVALFSLGNQTASAIVNAGRADFYGFEAEASVVLPQGLRLDGTLSYVHPKYVRYAPTGFDQSRERFQNVTPWTASISPSWSQEIGQAKVLLRGDFIYQSKSPLYTYNVYSCGAGLLCDASSGSQVSAADAAGYIDSSTDPAHWLINARGSISFMNDKYELAVWGKNLTNKRDNIVGLPIAPLGETANIKREPRSFGVTATVKFSQH